MSITSNKKEFKFLNQNHFMCVNVKFNMILFLSK